MAFPCALLAVVLVDLAGVDPALRFDIRYATARNFLGRPVYPAARAFLRPEVAKALAGANAFLEGQGLGLLVFDAYRPLSVTRTFWEEVPKEMRRFLADPARGSMHNRGCAVDVSLYDRATGREVEMPSPYDEMTARASPRYEGGPPLARARRDLLRKALEERGFRVNRGEWWHFDHETCPRYDVLDLTFEELGAPRDWIPLWNGRDLSGFIPKIRGHAVGENFGNTFRVENGVLKVSYEAYDTFDDRFGHLFYERPFSHYVLAVEYRFVGEQVKGGPDWAFRNSGLMIHGQPPSTLKKDQDFPISIEVQLLGGRAAGERPTANLCTPGTHVEMEGKLVTEHCVSSRSKTYRGDGWVRVEVEVHGSERIVHRVNGETVLRYERPQVGGGEVSGFDPAAKKDDTLLEEGSISLQSESHSIEFRKVELLNLVGCADPKARNHRPYVVKADPRSCIYP